MLTISESPQYILQLPEFIVAFSIDQLYYLRKFSIKLMICWFISNPFCKMRYFLTKNYVTKYSYFNLYMKLRDIWYDV